MNSIGLGVVNPIHEPIFTLVARSDGLISAMLLSIKHIFRSPDTGLKRELSVSLNIDIDADADRVIKARQLGLTMAPAGVNAPFRRYLAIYNDARRRWGYAFLEGMERAERKRMPESPKE